MNNLYLLADLTPGAQSAWTAGMVAIVLALIKVIEKTLEKRRNGNGKNPSRYHWITPDEIRARERTRTQVASTVAEMQAQTKVLRSIHSELQAHNQTASNQLQEVRSSLDRIERRQETKQ